MSLTAQRSATAVSTADRRLFGLPLAVVFVLCYFAFQTILVTVVSNGAGLDDAEQLANIGYLDWGMADRNPSLYMDYQSGSVSIRHINAHAPDRQVQHSRKPFPERLRCHETARLSRIVASASMLGLFLIPQIGWESQRALTHSVAGTAGCGWAFLAFAWHMRARHTGSAAALGVAMAAALLGKFNASFFLIMLIVTGLLIPEYRRILLSKLSIVTVLAFAICFGPTAFWMLAHKSSVLARANKFEIGASGNVLFDRLMGVESLVEAAFLFSILALAIAGIIALIHWKKRTAPSTPLTVGEKFIRLLILMGLVIVLVGVVATGANNVKDRWLQPVLFLTPALIASFMGRYRIGNRALIDYAVVSAVVALIVPPVLSYYLTYGSSSPPYGQLDYRHLYEEVQAKGRSRRS